MIRSAIIGYGNLGKSVEKVIADQPDMELVGIFSRRDSLDTDARVLPAADVEKYKEEVDILFVCLGSATDVPEQAPELAKHYTTVDTYDNHHEIPAHRAAMDAAAREGGNLAMISTGWDPGFFSLNRVLGTAVLPGADQMTFWGPGLSQGHSDAVRRVPGVKKGVQYTKPNPEAMEAVKRGEGADLKGNECHLRHCYVVAEDPAMEDSIRETIVNMPDYFAPYETVVDFISEEEFDRDHQGMPHGGQVITRGNAGTSGHVIEFGLTLERNPDFTAAVQVAYGRAAYRMKEAGEVGARTVFEVAPYLLSAEPLDDLIAGKL
ncbi:diaminopimelate dehydrogenase [Corynebacterium sp. H78]|uniref:diaminopimelate dehydrogenase n=1 Tax=Corynebacterium sp. H78 TaxID=3133417 RepID=UPI0030B7B08E